jgi:integrase/recombinase XerD
MSTNTISPLRRLMIEDMNARKLCAGTQRGHLRSCKRFAAGGCDGSRPVLGRHRCR